MSVTVDQQIANGVYLPATISWSGRSGSNYEDADLLRDMLTNAMFRLAMFNTRTGRYVDRLDSPDQDPVP